MASLSLCKIGMKAGSRPTPYGFRHTFIDYLKNAELSESLPPTYQDYDLQGFSFHILGKVSQTLVLN